MAKKKKTQLKPVARGFATTSVPKKVIPVDESVEISDEEPQDAVVTTTDDTANLSHSKGDALSDATTLANQRLQALVEKLQDKTEREITRVVKVWLGTHLAPL